MVDFVTLFIDRTVTKVRQLGYHKTADKLEQKKAQAKQYLIKQNWTQADMTGHSWGKDYNEQIVYGKMTSNHLRNTKGVCISPHGVMISYFDQGGYAISPKIWCSEFRFEIRE